MIAAESSIDQKYDVAISTACPSLENILLDTGDTSVQCINFLKEHDLGRATFSVLERMERNRAQAMKPFHGPENVPRLFDLLHIQNDAYIPALYFVTQDTLVANNLEEATRIGMGIGTEGKRYRVVTLSGDVVDKSGTMSGGGKQVSRGRMSANIQQEFSPVQIESLEKDTAKLKHELEEYQKRKRVAESKLSLLQTEVQENESRLQKASLDIDFCSAQCEVYKTQLNELMSNRVTVDPKEVERLEKRYKECQDVYNQIHTKFSKSEAEVEKLDERINAVGADKVQAQQKKINSVKKELDDLKSNISKANVSL
ncbi:hypothetical protein LOD99_1365 [Oopsacas minuta]|uniref:SMC hinge domain-containing protein n=1 Tax=Oopsacas minuta TaxID=111878 RepID=A0AAV7K6P9_9METZ|nr:hypothetical protein LOD99_1365 [Oopsacas minuta]